MTRASLAILLVLACSCVYEGAAQGAGLEVQDASVTGVGSDTGNSNQEREVDADGTVSAWEDMEEESAMDQMSKYYSQVNSETFEWWFKVADKDYVELARFWDWSSLLNSVAMERTTDDGSSRRSVRVLDVGCGSGKFPSILHDRLKEEGTVVPIELSYLDLTQASLDLMTDTLVSLGAPFEPALSFVGSILDIPQSELLRDGPYDYLYAVHSMYSFLREETSTVAKKLHSLLRPGGQGIIYALDEQSFYTRVHRMHARHVARRPRAIFTTSQDMEYGVKEAGLDFETSQVTFFHTVPGDSTDVLIKYLSKCSMWHMTLEDAQAATPYWDFVQSFYDEASNTYLFPQIVTIVTIKA